MNEKTTIGATVVLEGFHHWPQAPAHRDYLADRHRHLFHLTPEVLVRHDDRDIEFHDLRGLVTDWWQPDQGAQSCERIARNLTRHLTNLGVLVVRVTVSEDGTDFATYTPQEALQ